MKTKTLSPRLHGLVVTALLALAQTTTFAQDVTGDRLDIGAGHTLSGTGASIAGGDSNEIYADYATVAGGTGNLITTNATYGFIGGGLANVNDGFGSTIAGGLANDVSGSYSFIGGGYANSSTAGYSTIAGGYGNRSTNTYTAIGGGYNNHAGGTISFIGGGYANTNYGSYAVIGGGIANTASGAFSTIAGGYQANTPLYGQLAHASGAFSTNGDAQASEYVLRRVTTTNTPTELFLDNSSARMTIPSGATWAFDILVAARATTNAAGYQIKGVIKNTSGTTALVGAATLTVLGEDVGSWTAAASADNTNDALVIHATGDTSTIRWVATVRTTEVKF